MQNPKRTLLLLSLALMLTFSLMPLTLVKAQQQPLFKVTVIAPGNANLVRRQWGQIFVNSLQQLGIDARLIFLGWTPVYARVLTPPYSMVGKTYDNGGYDIELIGYTPGLKPEPRQLYYGGDATFFAPDGQNYYLWNNTESNTLLDNFITSTNATVQEQNLKKWQSVFFREVPASQIMYQSNHAIVTPELENYAWVYFNVQPSPAWLKGKTQVVYASTGEIESLIPPLSNSWYDTIVFTPVFNGLEEVNYAGANIPALVESRNVSTDGFRWTYNVRQNVKWHDLYDFNADDILFSYWALMNAATGSQFVGYFQSVFGSKIYFKWLNGTTTTLGTGTRVGMINATSTYKIDIKLPVLVGGKPYGYMDPYLLSFSNNIIPKHIFEKIKPADWTTSVFNTGEVPTGGVNIPGLTNYTYVGPIGTGPYKWVSYSPTAQLVHLQKFNQFWNASALNAIGQFGVTDYYIRYITDKTAAISALKNNEVDMLDPNYQMQTEVITPGAIEPAWGSIMPLEGSGRQEIGYNMRHPIFGTGVDTPLGKATPSRAAEAARYVRQAFDFAIPRQLIIDNLLSGFGQPGATPMLPTQPYLNSSVTARPYNLTASRDLLKAAGYTIPGPPPPPTLPSFVLGMSTTISGYYKDAGGNLLANKEIQLMVTTNNATYNSTSTIIGRTNTDVLGWYSFTVTPTGTGTYYYYLFDSTKPAGTEYTYERKLDVASVSDLFTPFNTKIDSLTGNVTDLKDQVGALQGQVQTLTIVAVVAIVIAIAIGALNFYMGRKKP